MSLVIIKQIPEDSSVAMGLEKYNRSQLPGCTSQFQAAENTDGRYVTGIDEDSYLVDKDEKEKVKQKRENLELKLGLDLSGRSSFWKEFIIKISSDSPTTYNLANPNDELRYTVLLANGLVAPTYESISDVRYKDANYYAYTQEGEISKEVSSRKKRDQAVSKLSDISESKEKLLLYGQYLEGIKYHKSLSEVVLYKMLRDFIEDKDLRNAVAFLNALKLNPEELQQKIIVDKGIKQKLIRVVKTDKKSSVFQYGQTTVGNTLEEVYKNLSSPEFAPELRSLQKELDNRHV